MMKAGFASMKSPVGSLRSSAPQASFPPCRWVRKTGTEVDGEAYQQGRQLGNGWGDGRSGLGAADGRAALTVSREAGGKRRKGERLLPSPSLTSDFLGKDGSWALALHLEMGLNA